MPRFIKDEFADFLECGILAHGFSLRITTGHPYVQSAMRKRLHMYYYFIDRDPDLGLIHVCVQPGSLCRSTFTATATSGSLAS